MAGYIGSKASVVSSGAERKKVFDITTTTTSLTGCSYTPNQVHVFHNGVRLVGGAGADFTATDGSTITLTNAAQAGDQVVVISYATFQPADSYTKTESDDRFVNDPNAVITVSGSNVGIGMTPTGALSIRPSGTGSEDTHFGYGANLDAYITTGSNGNVIFREGNGAGVTTEHMRIDSSGNVGIGTSSPYHNLQVTGTIKVATGNAQGILALGDGNGSTNNVGVWRGDANAPTTDGNFLNLGGYNGIVFATGAANLGSQTERMRVDGSGNVLIGCTSVPNSSTSGAGFAVSSLGRRILILSSSSTGNGVNLLSLQNPNGEVGSIQTSGSSTSYNTSSDYRLKENVTPLDGAADRLAQIPVHRFNFIADPDTTVDGFLAHEVQAFVPEAITGEKDGLDADGNPVYQGIDQSKLVPLLTAALQEALQKIDALEARVAALEAV